MSSSIIELERITKQYDDQYAVNQLSLSISEGEIFGLLGPNGAGKTTTILMMLGLSEPTSGNVRVSGIDATRRPIEVKRKVGYLPDNLGFYQNMTGLQNLLFTAELNNIPKDVAKDRANQLLKRVDLTQSANKKTGKYSKGMKQRLGLADVLMRKPSVIILDEPTIGIDPEGIRDFLQLIRELNEYENITVLLSSHQLHQVQQICDRVGIFVRGELLAKGDMKSLAEQLLTEDSYVISVAALPMDEELIVKLRSIEGVSNINQAQSHLEIYSNRDVTASVSKAIVESGSSLEHISRNDFGLDEIYHRYFEGRDPYEHDR